MTHQNYILAAYGIAFISMGLMVVRTLVLYRQTRRKLNQLMNSAHES